MDNYYFHMDNLSVGYNRKALIHDICIGIKKGEIVTLIGPNGSGKSTILKSITRQLQIIGGKVYFDDRNLNSFSYKELSTRMAVVLTERMRPELMTCHDIVATGRYPYTGKLGILSREDEQKVDEAMEAVHAQELGDRDFNAISDGQRQRVLLARAICQEPEIIILDEPTSSLSDHEIDNLFEIILRMQKKGITFIYISHRMEEIKRIGNSGTVLRDGKFVASIDDVKSMDMEQIIKLIVGRSLEEQYPARESHIGDVLLDVQGLSVKGLIEDVSFQVRRGEVLGFSGLVGAGRTTTAKAVFGALKKSVGRIFIDGKEVRIRSPHDAIRNGISLLPENRKEEGLILTKSIAWNLVFASLHKYKCGPFLNERKEYQDVAQYRDMLSIKAPSLERQIKYLSGGNQQKVVLAKWLSREPKVLILDNPTQGVDVGAKEEIYDIILKLAKEGVSVIVLSSEAQEIIRVCDRALVMYHGEIVGEVSGETMTEHEIMRLATGG